MRTKAMYQSEIRTSDINRLNEKVANKNYKKYIHRIAIVRARSFTNQAITFDFPVTALIGPNGGGKTTVLGAAACVYRQIRPAMFFAKSGAYDASMQNWRFEYEVIDRDIKLADIVKRTANFTSLKWSRHALDRDVRVFGVARTVPANERKELRRCVSSRFQVEDKNISPMGQQEAKAVASILDKDVTHFSFIKVDERGRVTLLAGETESGGRYSEFHFGAGESSIIRMVCTLESMNENSLVLIEEVENGLHPVATVRMVEYLIDLALRKNIQAIFTSHSNESLRPLPDRAIWAAVGGRLFQGKLDIRSLRAVTGQVNSKLVIFVEDGFSKMWIEGMLRNLSNVAIDAIDVYSMEGDGTAVKVHLYHGKNPSASQPSICFIDGDSKQVPSSENCIFRLPGEGPEAYIYDRVLEKIKDIAGELAVTLLRPYNDHKHVAEIIKSVRNTNRDPHLLFAQVGKLLGFIPEDRVKEAFISLWVRTYSSDSDDIMKPVMKLIPKETDETPLKP